MPDPTKPAHAECVASWVDDQEERIRTWDRIAAIPEPLGCEAVTMFGSYDFPDLTMLRLRVWKIRLSVVGDLAAPRVWVQSNSEQER